MNAVGEYDDIDMHGIEPRWYSSVPVSDQRRFIAAKPSMRVLWNEIAKANAIIVRDPAVAAEFNDGHLRGWSIAHTFTPGRVMPVEQMIAYANSADRWNEEWLDEWAPKGLPDVPADETLMQRVDRGISAMKDAAHAARDLQQENELSDLVDDEWSLIGKSLIGAGGQVRDLHGSMRAHDERLYSAMKAVKRHGQGAHGQLERVLRENV